MPSPEASKQAFDPTFTAMQIAEGTASIAQIEAFGGWLRYVDPMDAAKIIADPMHDDLTGLLSYGGLHKYYDQLAVIAQGDRSHDERHPSSLFVLMLDIEGVKYSNKIGFDETSNGLVRPLGQSFSKNARTSDYVGRLGGDEFTVVGIARTNERILLPEVAKRFAVRSLAGLLQDSTFVRGYPLDRAGVIVKAATISADTPWETMSKEVDPKQGMELTKYDYTQLPEGASMHRVYKDEFDSPFFSVGYLSTTSEGGYFVPYDGVNSMALHMAESGYDPSFIGSAQELTASEIPRPYPS